MPLEYSVGHARVSGRGPAVQGASNELIPVKGCSPDVAVVQVWRSTAKPVAVLRAAALRVDTFDEVTHGRRGRVACHPGRAMGWC